MYFVYIILTMADIHFFFVICEYGFIILISLFVRVKCNVMRLYIAFFFVLDLYLITFYRNMSVR